jgi:hypothetical protein
MPTVARRRLFGTMAAVIVALLTWPAGEAAAARVRYHYAPAPPGTMAAAPPGTVPPAAPAPPGTVLKLDAPGGVQGQRLAWNGSWEPYNCPPPRPTCQMNYRHPVTGQLITVPLALPDSTPRLEHRGTRVIYDYGSYTVEVSFLPDGCVDVVYNSGLFRAPEPKTCP